MGNHPPSRVDCIVRGLRSAVPVPVLRRRHAGFLLERRIEHGFGIEAGVDHYLQDGLALLLKVEESRGMAYPVIAHEIEEILFKSVIDHK